MINNNNKRLLFQYKSLVLKRVKTLRNFLGQSRLNHVMLMNIHKEETKIMSLAGVANEFAAKYERRREDFGINNFM